jgi:hypothetical protein
MENTVYQIACSGEYKSTEGHGKYSSKKVYKHTPTQDEIDDFIDKCCNSVFPNDLFDLDINTVTVRINELIIID